MNSRSQSFFVYFLLIVAIGAMLYMGFRENTTTEKPLTINEVAQAVQEGKVARIIIKSDDTFTVVYTNGTEEQALNLVKSQMLHWWNNLAVLALRQSNLPLKMWLLKLVLPLCGQVF